MGDVFKSVAIEGRLIAPANFGASVITISNLVSIYPDGTLKYHEGYNPDEAAKIFWEALAFHFPGRNKKECTCHTN